MVKPWWMALSCRVTSALLPVVMRFDFVAREYGVPAAIAGFEVLDILTAVHSLLVAIMDGRGFTVNCYPRVVKEHGNIQAKNIMKCDYTVSSV